LRQYLLPTAVGLSARTNVKIVSDGAMVAAPMRDVAAGPR
jgi:hypothetical protein